MMVRHSDVADGYLSRRTPCEPNRYKLCIGTLWLFGRLEQVYGTGMRDVRLYLRLGDRVFHDCREAWGTGAVVEEMTSTIEGGTCLVRILFDDGHQRTFNNDLDSDMCCYRMGLKREQIFDWDGMATASARRGHRTLSRRPVTRLPRD